jgi:hypothetical protein
LENSYSSPARRRFERAQFQPRQKYLTTSPGRIALRVKLIGGGEKCQGTTLFAP